MFKLYNSLSRKKERFVPSQGNKVKMYVCGITPYDTTHLGHAFTYVFFDVLVRYLTYKGYEVIYTQNVTDIDDDILKRAKEENKDWKELGDFWTKKFLNEMKLLNVLSPTYYVKATDSIAKIVEIIKLLIDKGFAYEKNGNVYFEVNKFEDYGKLSRFNQKQMLIISKERGGNPDDPLKKNPLDFLLWQKSKTDEPVWESPWSRGRPGWHIECSSMIKNTLSDQIDIHGGGRDLIFPHHESEIAQSESFTGKKPFVKFWMHTAMVLYQGEKMAKSLGNLVMVSDLLKKYSPNIIRWVLLSHHYRVPWEFSQEELKEAQKKTKLIMSLFPKDQNLLGKIDTKDIKQLEFYMDEDINTPKALNYLENIYKRIQAVKNREEKTRLQNTLLMCLSVLGFTPHQNGTEFTLHKI